MFYFSVLLACLAALPRSQADPRAGPRRYKPIIQVTEEIDINDITFTTSAPSADFSSSHPRYGAPKSEGGAKASHNRLGDASPGVFPRIYGNVVPVEKVYATGQPLVVPVAKYKPYKVLKVQDGYRPVSYKSKVHDKSKFEPSSTYPGPDAAKQNSKIIPFSSQPPTRAATFGPQDHKNFVPSPTFSPTVLALINAENQQKFSASDTGSFATQKTADWPKPTKKPQHIRVGKKIPENHQSGVQGGDFPATEKHQENLTPYNAYKESPQQSESFLSEISTMHKGGEGLDEMADSLDLKTGERVEFQMYGMDGPQSYKFGFDTGKGENRHFRFEERDNTGKVKGHYGYLDEDGKMRIMKYEADPITGFHAGPVEISPDDN